MLRSRLLMTLGLCLGAAAWPSDLRAHCDTLDGPVVSAARIALHDNDVTPVLKWVREAQELELRQAFRQAIAVRALGPEAAALADRFFFETAVRLHRFGEGEPYTGLKENAEADPGIEAVDRALDTGRIDALTSLIADQVASTVRDRVNHVRELRQHADDSVAAGRHYVEAYVELIHYVERLNPEYAAAER